MFARLILVGLLVAVMPALADGGRFVAGTSDLPLMDGLVEDNDATLIWDKPEGRIVEAEAHGNVSADQVASFYRLTLGQLGWVPTANDLVFVREDEKLTITVDDSSTPTAVHFTLEPK